MKYLLFLIVCLISFPAPAQEQTACTNMGCVNGVTIKFDPKVITGPGHYELRIVADEAQITCKGSIPFQPCDQGTTFTCNSRAVRVSESGCNLPPEQQSVSEILIGGRPRHVILGASRDGTNFMIRDLKPVYRFFRPNGPSCEPQCVVSTVNLDNQLDQK